MAQPLTDSRQLELLESQGYREQISAHLFANAVRVAPGIDDKHVLLEQAGEELAHFEVIAAMFERVCAKNLYDAVAARAEALPMPASWLEIAVAAYLVDRAAAVQLAGRRGARITAIAWSRATTWRACADSWIPPRRHRMRRSSSPWSTRPRLRAARSLRRSLGLPRPTIGRS